MKSERSKKSSPYIYRSYLVSDYSLECPWCKMINGILEFKEIEEGTTRRCYYCKKLIRITSLKTMKEEK